jgi:hypothetical protein
MFRDRSSSSLDASRSDDQIDDFGWRPADRYRDHMLVCGRLLQGSELTIEHGWFEEVALASDESLFDLRGRAVQVHERHFGPAQ